MLEEGFNQFKLLGLDKKEAWTPKLTLVTRKVAVELNQMALQRRIMAKNSVKELFYNNYCSILL